MRVWPDPACPSCNTPIRIGVPYGATVTEIGTEPNTSLEAQYKDETDRTRKLTARCPAGHLAHVYYSV